MFTSRAFIKVCLLDHKDWPADSPGQQKKGALLRKWYLDHARTLVEKDRMIDGQTFRSLLTGDKCGHGSVEEYFDLMRKATNDSK